MACRLWQLNVPIRGYSLQGPPPPRGSSWRWWWRRWDASVVCLAWGTQSSGPIFLDGGGQGLVCLTDWWPWLPACVHVWMREGAKGRWHSCIHNSQLHSHTHECTFSDSITCVAVQCGNWWLFCCVFWSHLKCLKCWIAALPLRAGIRYYISSNRYCPRIAVAATTLYMRNTQMYANIFWWWWPG